MIPEAVPVAPATDLETPDAPNSLPATPGRPETWSIGSLTYNKTQLIILFCWLLWGDFAWSMKDRAVSPVAQIIIKHYHATDMLMSLFLVALPAAVGILLGPTISFKSDRHRGRFGRRIPYLALTTPVGVLAMFGLGFSPALGGWLHHLSGWAALNPNQVVLMLFGMFWVLFEIATVAANAVFGALINDVVPHQFLGRFYGLFRAFSLIAGMIFNYKLLGFAEKHSAELFLGVGLLYGAGFALMCFVVKEGTYPPPDDIREGEHPGFVKSARIYLKECFTNPFYLWLIAAMVVSALVFLPVNSFSIPFAQSLHIKMETYGKYLALTYLISLCLSYFLGSLADKFHPLRIGIVAMALYAVVTLFGAFFANGPAWYGPVLVAHGVISGTFFTCTASLGQRLFPQMRFAQFASAAGMIGAIANMVFAPSVGMLLDLSRHMYRLTYSIGFVLAVVAVFLLWEVQKQFLALGGPAAYVAPE